MTTWNHLSRPLRLTLAAPWLLLLGLATAAFGPAFHALQVNTVTHQPAEPFNVASANIVGTLSDARLSANIPRLVNGGLAVGGASTLDGGGIATDGSGDLTVANALIVPEIYSAGGDPSIDLSDPGVGTLRDDGDNILSWTYGGVQMKGDVVIDAGGLSVNNGITLQFGSFCGDGSGLSGNATGMTCGAADAALFANAAAATGATFNDFFGLYNQMQDVSLPGDGSASFANGNFYIGFGGDLYASEGWFRVNTSGGIGLFGQDGPDYQPLAIANATDLTSAINAINAWLADARMYGLVHP